MSSVIEISIITPSYNHGRFIRQTIESVLAQDYKNIEHIIIDGGSTDETLDILGEYEHLIWVSERDKGAADAINKGVRMARGEVVGWLNSDDYYDKGAITKVMDSFAKNNKYGIVYGNLTYVDNTGNIIREEKTEKYDLSKLIRNNADAIRQPCTFFRKTLFEKVGGLDENLKCVFDYDLFLKMLKITDAYYIDSNLTYYRDYPDTLTRKFIRRQGREIIRVALRNGAGFFDRIIAKSIIKKILFPNYFIK